MVAFMATKLRLRTSIPLATFEGESPPLSVIIGLEAQLKFWILD